ncbi:hypothetical protein P168DRAFT_99293 [Aspergillus campestris IBT 28561]|uniref:F-box domain-containing protein n=1 Tax=Aspergillus campestris (strain IBT 28561) TaxID=1392248 RepID=A0A2I1DCM8_ASPC2|nr:uncharacterized protein P168DRAFT_99293 [Aspergillus campestris IBT 28561]PKY07638.1 hypothetical protein P168DRAFT_99293 [Aspergillus campestris IBT 28561]
MSSGTAYRWDHPGMDFLHLYPTTHKSRPVVNLYKAPPIKRMSGKLLVPSLASQLPLELIHQIFLELDVPSLGQVRRVNLATRHLVESFPVYQLLRQHAPDALRVMHATKCASFFPIHWLFTEFCQPWCRSCGEFGPYLYLPTVTRLCFQCCLFSPDYRVAPVRQVMFHFGISRHQIKSLPVIHNISEEEFPGEGTQRHKFVDVAQAQKLGLRKHGSLETMKQLAKERSTAADDAYRQRRGDLRQGRRTKPVRRRGIPPHPAHNGDADFWRHCGATAFPYWDCETQTLEPGTYCRACTYHWEEKVAEDKFSLKWPIFPAASWKKQPSVKVAYDRAFRATDLPGHFLHCRQVRKRYDFSKRQGPPLDWPWQRSGEDFLVSATGQFQLKK